MSAALAVDPRADEASRGLGNLRALIDVGFALVLTGLALYGLRTTYSGHHYLLVGLAGAVLGIALPTLTTWPRWPVWTLVLLVPAAYYVLGPGLVLDDWMPNVDAWRSLTHIVVDGWKQLLTTLPPVAGGGPLLAIPFLLGLLGAAIATAAAQRSRSRFAPASGPVLALGAVILLGTAQPAARLEQGIAFGVLVLCWAGVRRPGGRRLTLRPTPGGPQRLVIGALVLAVAGVGAVWLGPHLPGSGEHRVVLRNYVSPPFDVAAYPSPMVGFRKYTKDAKQLYDQDLFTVRGLPSGASVRLATLDDYDGSVWGATNGTVPTGPGQPIDSFARVGSRVDSTASGRAVDLRVRIDRAYAAANDIDAWVPTSGTLRSIDFHGSRSGQLADSFRYNLATGTGAVASRLAAGDSYTVRAVLPSTSMPHDAVPYGTPTLDPGQDAFVASRASQWSAKEGSVLGQVQAVARYMHDHGAYSDGGQGESEYLPGHSVNRLTNFLNLPQLVGDDEQYGATFALMCNYLGMPARAVLVADDVHGGVVQGRDVHVDVEVHVRSGASSRWVTISHNTFMPDKNKKPNKQQPQTIQDANAAVVPPPNPIRPPSTLDQPDRPDQNTQHLGKVGHGDSADGSGWIGFVLRWVGIPVGAIALLCLLIVGVKWRRRVLRRSRGEVPARFDAGWRELLDAARDLGAVVPRGRTRLEQALALASRPAGDRAEPLAHAADAGIFAAGDPASTAAVAYWRDIDDARRAMARAAGRFGPLRAALNLRSLRRPTRAVRPT